MCYGSKPVVNSQGGIDWVPNTEFNRLYRDGIIVVHDDGYHYAKDTIGVLLARDGKIAAAPMRWDLIPRRFLQKENPTLAEALRKKNSRAKDPRTGKPVGFSSWNAKVETLTQLYSFRDPWNEGLRIVAPVSGFKERPNMEEAPGEFQGREYEVLLDGEYFLAGIYDLWRNDRDETLESCTIITMDSAGNDKIRSIWHERTPIILDAEQAEAWLDPDTTPSRALEMCRLFPADRMEVREIPKSARPAKPAPEQRDGGPEQLSLL